MQDMWNTLTQNSKVLLTAPVIYVVLGAVFSLFGYFGKKILEAIPSEPTKTISYKKIIITIFILVLVFLVFFVYFAKMETFTSFSLKQYEQELYRRKAEITKELKQTPNKDSKLLDTELQALLTKLQDIPGNYKKYSSRIKELRFRLKTSNNQLLNNLIKVSNALELGDEKLAEQLLKQHEEQSNSSITVEAEIAYQRCLIAERNIDYSNALEHCHKAIRYAPKISIYLNQTGRINQVLANFNEAIKNFSAALENDLKSYDEDHPSIAIDYINLGSAQKAMGQYQKAIESYDKACSIFDLTPNTDFSNKAEVYNNMGVIYKILNEYDKAITFYDKSLTIRQKLHANKHIDIAESYNNLGGAYSGQGEFDEAIKSYRKAQDDFLSLLGEHSPRLATVYNNLGAAYAGKEDYLQANNLYQKALKIRIKVFGKIHPKISDSYNNIGTAYSAIGEYNTAISYYEDALNITNIEHIDVGAIQKSNTLSRQR